MRRPPFFQTTIEFRPRLEAQRDHAEAQGQTQRQELYERLVTGVYATSANR